MGIVCKNSIRNLWLVNRFFYYPSTSKGFKLYDIENDKMFVSHDAKLLENNFLHDDSRSSQNLLDLSTVFTE